MNLDLLLLFSQCDKQFSFFFTFHSSTRDEALDLHDFLMPGTAVTALWVKIMCISFTVADRVHSGAGPKHHQ